MSGGAWFETIEKLSADERVTVVRARVDGTPVVVKLLTAARPRHQDVARFHYAWELGQGIDVPQVCRTLALRTHERRPALVLEDIGGRSLRAELADGPLPLARALRVGVEVARALEGLHALEIVHRDVNPANVVATADGRAQLIDLEIASRLPRERLRPVGIGALEGTLAYLAPEQTGRVNRGVDHRADLYALGATLFELLTGQPPFSHPDPVALVHAHIALAPPRLVDRGFAPALSRVVELLLAKTPEDRYQSARGVRADLERCLAAVEAGRPIPDFTPRGEDFSPRLAVSQRLYGRETEREALFAAYRRARAGEAVLACVSGWAGVGKSALVRELGRPVAEDGGWLASGKFDQARILPFGAWVGAIREVVREALLLPAEERAALRERLAGPGAAVVAGLVPEVEALVGAQAPLPPVMPAEAHNRFRLGFQRFVQALARPEAPLVLVLDDLQWADTASVDLLEQLLRDPASRSLLVVAAWRSNEVDEAHPALVARRELARSGVRVVDIEPGPLGLPDVTRMVADSLGTTTAEVGAIAALLHQRTDGNPLFVEQSLTWLVEQRVLRPDAAARRWLWDADGLATLHHADNVLDVLARSIRELPADTAELLRLAATLGNRFSLGWLAHITGSTTSSVARSLWPALRAGLLVPVSGDHRLTTVVVPSYDGTHITGGEVVVEDGAAGPSYRFLHDRIQEAAWAGVPEGERPGLHRRIGLRLAELADAGGGDELFLAATAHLDAGRALIGDPEARRALAARNLEAARRAAARSAFGAAVASLEVARELLGAEGWEADRALAFGVHRMLAEVAPMAGDLPRGHAALVAAKAHVASPDERWGLLFLELAHLAHQSRFAEAVDVAFAALTDLGLPHPSTPEEWGAMVGREMGAVQALLAERDVASLLDAPPMTDPAATLQILVLASVAPSASTIPHVAPAVFARMAHLSIAYGTAVPTPVAYGAFGYLLAAMGRLREADAFGQLAVTLAERMAVPSVVPVVYHLCGSFPLGWCNPWSQSLHWLRLALEKGMEAGVYTSAGWAAMNEPLFAFASGADLPNLLAITERLERVCRYPLGAPDALRVNQFIRLTALRLAGRDDELARLAGAGLTLASATDALGHYPGAQALGMVPALAGAVIRGAADEAAALIERLTPTLPYQAGHAVVAECAFWTAMASALARPDDLADRLRAALGPMEAWAEAGSTNFAARAELLRAELAWAEGRDADAGQGFDEAARRAGVDGHPMIQALATERAARFYLDRGRATLGRAYLGEARVGWMQWGAAEKVAALDRELPAERGAGPSATRTTGDPEVGFVDVQAVLRATEAFAGELDLGSLLGSVLGVVLATAGATRVVLALRRGGGLAVLARARAGEAPEVLLSEPVEASIPAELAARVVDTGLPEVVADVAASRLGATPGFRAHPTRSALCVPLVHRKALVGLLYAANDLSADAFPQARVSLLAAIAGQAAVALQNAVLVRDLTEQARELARTNEQLTEMGRLREDILARTSHELRTPLNGIIGLAEATRDGASPAESTHALDLIAASGRRLARLVDDILDTAVLERGALTLRRSPVRMDPLVQRALTLAQTLARGRPLEVRAEVDPATPPVWGDPERVEQVLLNLVGNAVKFTERGEVVIQVVPEGDRVAVEVSDTGIGIAPEAMDRIFLPFEQAEASTTRRFGGTGLGLSIARQLVEQMGGALTARSTPGEGSTFRFVLPVARGAELLPADTARPAPSVLERPEDAPLVVPEVGPDAPLVLAVDDEPVNLQVMVSQLARRGYRVQPARSGPEALELLAGGARPDLVLLDVMMPLMDGYEVCARIRAEHPGLALPVVMLTARNRPADVASGLEAGANDYVTKPFSELELHARIRTQLQLGRVHRAVSRFVPDRFLHLLGRDSVAEVRLGDSVEREMSVLFADVREFTSLSERMSPAETFAFLNELLGRMEPEILGAGGFVDKYLGDGIMALFDEAPDDAVRAGIAMQRALPAFNAGRAIPIRMGIGVNTGTLMLGTVGGPRRMDTTVVSDAVNTAARTEELTKRYHASLLISGETRDRLRHPDAYRMRLLDHIQVRGRAGMLTVYEVYEAEPEAVRAAREATRPNFERAVQLFRDRAIDDAMRLFSLCQAMDPQDAAVGLYLQRCRAIQAQFQGYPG